MTAQVGMHIVCQINANYCKILWDSVVSLNVCPYLPVLRDHEVRKKTRTVSQTFSASDYIEFYIDINLKRFEFCIE